MDNKLKEIVSNHYRQNGQIVPKLKITNEVIDEAIKHMEQYDQELNDYIEQNKKTLRRTRLEVNAQAIIERLDMLVRERDENQQKLTYVLQNR